MTPAEKMDEIVRALEDVELVHTPKIRRALTLARELRAGAVEGYRIAFPNGQNVYYDDADPPDARNVRPALLIVSKPSP